MYVCVLYWVLCAFIVWNCVIHGMWNITLTLLFDSSVIAE